jgi:hypothetical protein
VSPKIRAVSHYAETAAVMDSDYEERTLEPVAVPTEQCGKEGVDDLWGFSSLPSNKKPTKSRAKRILCDSVKFGTNLGHLVPSCYLSISMRRRQPTPRRNAAFLFLHSGNLRVIQRG